jgi:hypothetical protein
MSRTTLIKFWIAAAILGALLVGRHAAHAATFGQVWAVPNDCVVVMWTADGFTNLRAAPNGPVLARMRPGELLRDAHDRMVGDWLHVVAARPIGWRSDGWISTNYVAQSACGPIAQGGLSS